MNRGRCDECDRPMRPRGTPARDYPGTVVYRRPGQCGTCYQREYRRDRREYIVGDAATTYARCEDCNQRMRPRGAHLEDHPGTVTCQGPNQCRTCYRRECRRDRREYIVGDAAATYARCEDCNQCMRPGGAHLADHPGTVAYRHPGQCNSCSQRQLRTTPQISSERLGELRRQRVLFEAERHQRYVPPTGRQTVRVVISGLELAA